jgi:hypothetical protein
MPGKFFFEFLNFPGAVVAGITPAAVLNADIHMFISGDDTDASSILPGR